MLPLILLALGLGTALAVYEFSPQARESVDDYARALREAHAAHRAADASLGDAATAMITATQHAYAQAVAQQQVAQQQVAAPPAVSPVPVPPPSIPTPVVVSPPAAPPVAPPSAFTPSVQDVADAHGIAGQIAADASIDHVAVAQDANQEAARRTAEAAQQAKTEAEQAAVAQSAAKVIEREKKIAAALASLGVGQCGVRSYARVTPQVKDALIAKLHAEGMAVTGDNPWNIITNQYDVKLRAVWDPTAQVLKLIVTAGKGGYFGLVTCDEIWKKIDPIMRDVIR